MVFESHVKALTVNLRETDNYLIYQYRQVFESTAVFFFFGCYSAIHGTLIASTISREQHEVKCFI